MLRLLLQKILIALIATVLFSFISAWFAYTPEASQASNTSYISFIGLVLLNILFVASLYFTVGILASWLIDAKVTKVFLNFLSYLLCGAIVGGAFYSFNMLSKYMNWSDFISFSIAGASAAVIFWFIQKAFQLFVFTKPASNH